MPKNVAELFRYLDATLEETVKGELLSLPEDTLYEMHFGLNAFIRSVAFYKNESETGKAYFSNLGDPDSASGVLGEMYWAHLHRRPMTQEFVTNSVDRHWIFFMSDAERDLTCLELINDYKDLSIHG
ncbi:DUF6794 domain-containing protein [Undibacterium rugosum]|uniref:DUF6794 domain-containing protein n=1 Tax=Undibacterium rugosum TaxID=2762291 RepID=UPI001B82A4C3|nr:DUF6794 domain-containing protein [Undibacterium rugosum]MBR7780420.1 hypothetical protein [Undibacterium rugosum]